MLQNCLVSCLSQSERNKKQHTMVLNNSRRYNTTFYEGLIFNLKYLSELSNLESCEKMFVKSVGLFNRVKRVLKVL